MTSRTPLPAAAKPPSALTVSLIIPTYNEADTIVQLLDYLRQQGPDELRPEILVVDGGSTDGTPHLAQQAGATVLASSRKGRAAQLNYGARQASGELLYFLHADSYPPPGFLADLQQAVAQGYPAGCYRLAFDHGHWFLRFSAWCTRLPFTAVRFGDQSLYVRRELFAQVGGYREDLLLMEDQDIVARLRARAPFRLLPGVVTTSARKYLANGVFRLQGLFFLITGLYYLGVPQPTLVRVYRRLIRLGKV